MGWATLFDRATEYDVSLEDITDYRRTLLDDGEE